MTCRRLCCIDKTPQLLAQIYQHYQEKSQRHRLQQRGNVTTPEDMVWDDCRGLLRFR